MSQPRLDQPPLALITHMLLDSVPKLLPGRRRSLLLNDAGARPDHLGQRPGSDTFALGEAAAAVPADAPLDPVDVLFELPQQPRLPAAGLADYRDDPSAALPLARLKRLDDQRSLTIAPHQRRFESRLRFAPPVPATTLSAVHACTGASRPF